MSVSLADTQQLEATPASEAWHIRKEQHEDLDKILSCGRGRVRVVADQRDGGGDRLVEGGFQQRTGRADAEWVHKYVHHPQHLSYPRGTGHGDHCRPGFVLRPRWRFASELGRVYLQRAESG